MADERTAPTTDCPACGRTAKECSDGAAKGWDNCCMVCDKRGRVASHRLRAVTCVTPTEETDRG